MKRRDMKFVTSALQAAKPMLLKKITDFDSQEFLLNTPSATYDLRDGRSKEHAAEDLITKITAVSPGTDNYDRGLDIPPADKETEMALAILMKEYN